MGTSWVARLITAPRRSFTTRLILAIALLTIGAVALQSLVFARTTRARLEAEAGAALANSAVQLSALIERGLFERSREIRNFAGLEFMADPAVSLERKQALLELLQESYPDYAWIGLTDQRGRVIAGTDLLLVGEDVSARPWFTAALAALYIGDVHEAVLLAQLLPNPEGEPLRFIDIAAPVYAADGSVAGVLGAHLSDRWADDIAEVFATLPQSRMPAEALVLSSNDLVVVGPPELHNQPLDVPSIAAARRGETGAHVEVWPDGKRYLVGYHQETGYRNYPSLGWVILIREPVDVAFAPIAAAERQLILGNLLFGGALIAVFWLLAGAITQPIRRLAAASERLRNDPSVELPLFPGQDEVARLSVSLRELVDGLHTQERKLARVNDELSDTFSQYVAAEHRRSMSEEQLRLLIEGVRDYAIFMIDLDGCVISWNAGAEQIMGYRAEEVLGIHISMFYENPDDADTTLFNAVQSGHYVTEGLRRRKNGELFWAHVTLTALRSTTGLLRGFAKVTQDISLRVAAESQLKESRARLAGIVDSAMDAIITVDSEQRIVLFNRSAEQMFGYSAAEAQGMHLGLLIPVAARDVHRRYVRNFARTGATTRSMQSNAPLYALRRDQSQFPIEASISHITVNGQSLYTAIVRDISARTRLEAQFRQAQKMEVVGHLAGGIAHDFNNLLSVINGYSDLLLEAYPDAGDPTHDDVQMIRQAGERAAGLTRQLLAFSRRQALQPQVLDLNAVLVETEKLLRRLIGTNITVQLQLDPDLWPVYVDRVQLEQVVMNLAVNARDAMPGGGTLTFKTRNCRADPEREELCETVQLIVADNGTGMTPDTLEHLFEPFYTTKEPGHGTGLGLATVHGIVTQSGGSIAVASQVGGGTTFIIDLPRSKRPDEAASGVETVGLRPQGVGRILLVEDEAPIRAMLVRVLQREGYEVLEAASAVEALQIYDMVERIDLLVSDVMMPGMSGEGLAQELRCRNPHLRVLLMSGYLSRISGEVAQQVELFTVLRKPFTPAMIIDAVRATLKQP